MLLRNKKRGQVAETVTWLVATIVILVILSIAIYTASALSKINRVVTISVDSPPILIKKSLQGYLMTNDTMGKSVFNQIEADEGLNKFNDALGKKIFVDSSKKFNFRLLVNSFGWVSPYKEIKINEDLTLEVFLTRR